MKKKDELCECEIIHEDIVKRVKSTFPKDETIFERKTYHCAMHKANVRANNYFWKRYENVTKNVSPLRYNKYVNSSSKNKYLYILKDNSFEYCNVNSTPSQVQTISDELYSKAIKFCDDHFFTPVHVGFNEQREFGYYIGNIFICCE